MLFIVGESASGQAGPFIVHYYMYTQIDDSSSCLIYRPIPNDPGYNIPGLDQ